jgi:hypothetical protein
MDKLTPDEVLARIDEFAEKLHKNAQAQRWNKLLDWFATSLSSIDSNDRLARHKELIRRAVTLHIEEVAKKNTPS